MNQISSEYDDGMLKAIQQIARACGKTFTVDIGYEDLPKLVEDLVEEHSKLRHVLINKLGFPLAARDNEIAEAVEKLITERDEAASNALAFSTELNELMPDELLDRLGLENGYTPEQFHASMKVLFNERDKAVRSLESAGFIDNGCHLWKPPIGTPPQYLSQETRYVLHGDIQPCTVLYSDDTTTLLRLDEGDVMCETDTIEWSDSVTYRCQELLKSVDVRSLGHVAPRLAQLVRDERVSLNDNGGEEVDASSQGTSEFVGTRFFGVQNDNDVTTQIPAGALATGDHS